MLLLKHIFLGYMDNAQLTLAWLTSYVILFQFLKKISQNIKKIGRDEEEVLQKLLVLITVIMRNATLQLVTLKNSIPPHC